MADAQPEPDYWPVGHPSGRARWVDTWVTITPDQVAARARDAAALADRYEAEGQPGDSR